MIKRKDEMKAYATVDEWLDSVPTSAFTLKESCEWWAREAWKQAMRSARVQEMILLGEMKTLREELQGMEKKWNTSWNEEDN